MTNLHGNADESQRLNHLQSYDILDTLSEKDYDDITLMASIICEVPVALISFVDDKRQWFKSHYGVDISETPREYSFCAHAIHSNEPFIIEDARNDSRFATNPLTTDKGVIFYAGVPLINEDGFGLGTVCVIDHKPRKLSDKQLAGLKILTNQVANLLKMRKINLQLHNIKNSLITENIKLNEDGRLLGLGLEKQISKGIADMTLKNIELEKMNKELEAFTYISSHDLQEPLRKIQIFVSMLHDRELENLSPAGLEYIEKIQRSSHRMRALIDDLLAYSRTSFAKKIYEQTVIADVVDEIKEDLQEEIERSDAKITVTGDCHINAIAFQFRQLIYNLVSNSLKFARKNTIPEIAIYCELKNGSALKSSPRIDVEKKYFHLTVTDNGIGFDPIYNEKIFLLFQRLTGKDESVGTGIGLAIVKRIVENHGGFIEARSIENVETTFEMFFPENNPQS